MKPELYVHIGIHKTGSTSIQHYLNNHNCFFGDNNFHIVSNNDISKYVHLQENIKIPATNLFTLANLITRPKLLTPVRINKISITQNFFETSAAIKKINAALHEIDKNKLILSAEGFSFLRTPEEHFLFDLLSDGFNVKTLGFYRNERAWTKSWQRQISGLKKRVTPHLQGQGTIFDLSPNSWLFKRQALFTIFPNLIWEDYDKIIAVDRNVIPRYLEFLRVNVEKAPKWIDYQHNRS